MVASTIRSRANDCLVNFNQLISVEGELQGGQKPSREQNGIRADDQLARFHMWTGNIGVFADGHAALDYRVRNSEEAKRLMMSFLETLSESLQRAAETLQVGQMHAQRQSDDDLLDVYEPSASSIASSSFVGTETESVVATPDVPLSAFEQRLQNIEKTIDRLYRLSVAIRQPSILNQNTKAEKFPILDDEGNVNDSEFANFAFKLTKHHFPEAPRKLLDRLAAGIVIRRKRFLYRNSHQKKLSTRTGDGAEDNATATQKASSNHGVESTIRTVRALKDLPTEQRIQIKGVNSGRAGASMTSASALALSPLPLKEIMDDQQSKASTAFTNTFSRTSPLAIPNPPKPIPGSKEFECPYCCIILPIDHAKASKWRRHVMKDLEPYTCLFEECTDDKLFFADKKAWLSHMRHTHTTRWLCTSSIHGTHSFSSAADYDQHMRTMHKASFTTAQLPLLRERSKVPTLSTFEQCPLCGYVPTNEDIETIISAHGMRKTRQEDILKIKSDRICTHLAGHLESLSLRALPWQDVVEDCQSEASESDRADKDTARVQDGSSYFSGSQPPQSSKDDIGPDNESFSWSDERENAVTDDSSSTSYEEEWNFIPRPDYYGQDRDPVLQTMLKKLYLNTSSITGEFSEPKLPAYLVPLDKNENFFSRARALDAIEEVLCPDPTALATATKPSSYPLCFAVHGPGGMGKTQLAAHFVATHRKRFDAVLWVHADSAHRITQDFRGIALGLGIVSEKSPDATDLAFTRDLLKRWLVNPTKDSSDSSPSGAKKASWLLVFDNVEDASVLDEFWPYNGPGSILITSRNPSSWGASLELKPFTITEAVDYLLKITERESSEEERSAAEAIARRLGGLPLALAQMGGIISHEELSFGDFLRSYQDPSGQQELLSWSIGTSVPQLSNYEHNVASVWAFDTLSKGTMLLNVLSMLEPDGVPESVFNTPVIESDSTEIAELKTNYKQARNELLIRSLISGNKRHKKLFTHRLVQDVARSRMGSSELRQAFHAAVSLICAIWPFEPLTSWRQSVARWDLCEELFPNVQRLKDTFHEISPSTNHFADYSTARLLIDAGWYLYERGRSGDALVFTNVGQSICESMKLRLVEHPEYASENPNLSLQITNSLSEITHNRGCIALETNEPVDALRYLKMFNATMIKELTDKPSHNDMRLAISWNELGNAYMLQQKWSKGEACFRQSMDEMRKLKIYEPTLVSLPVVNLGLAHWFQGNNDEAIAVLTRGLGDRESVFGVDDRISFITGRILHALGNVKYSQKLFDESLEFHRRALIHHKQTIGHRHHRTADIFVRVADHNIRLQRCEMALALLDHALEAYSVSQQFMPERARASFVRVRTLRALKREQEAENELSKCFKIYTALHKDWARHLGIKEEEQKKLQADLTEEDLDKLVTFWSR